ncbi:unnamed protein product [Cylindrotheca closterium]|uniref:Uncharacterized protein n=1 Tax=Cylindrotheca closterium TaxID=2856 RepID=A0AAD2FXS1_9STRA|nr:unnamed protein product [Cylindrotheca closterium]
MIQIFAGKYAGHEAWMDNSQTWHVNKGTDTASVIVRLHKGMGLVQSTIWKSSFQGKDFRILDATYHHDLKNHVFVLEAVAVLVQYAMDHGHPIFPANTGDHYPDSDV